jgi:hypothetical protein
LHREYERNDYDCALALRRDCGLTGLGQHEHRLALGSGAPYDSAVFRQLERRSQGISREMWVRRAPCKVQSFSFFIAFANATLPGERGGRADDQPADRACIGCD